MEGATIPTVKLNSGQFMPTIGFGTASDPTPTAEAFQSAMLEAISVGYRHFDTASLYGTEQRLGDAVTEAIQRGLIKSREELFITSKLWLTDAHEDRVIPALQLSLRNLQLEYLDLYLIHWPVSLKPKQLIDKEDIIPMDLESVWSLIDQEDIIPMDLKSVWKAMEECQTLGLVKSIGVSNFSSKKLELLLSSAQIVPSVNQVEMHPIWQQKKLMNFCKEKDIHVVAYSPLGSNGNLWGTNQVMECEVLKEIAMARGKSIAQVSLRWIHEQGASLVVKSFRKERMKGNIEIFDWELSKEELLKISLIPQCKIVLGDSFVSATGPFKSLDELWDGEI